MVKSKIWHFVEQSVSPAGGGRGWIMYCRLLKHFV